MYPYKYIIPSNNKNMYRNSNNFQGYVTKDGERFFWAPFVVGGLAGTALGYGIANNNQLNNMKPCCGGYYYPIYQMPYYPNSYSSYSSNNFYY